MWADCSRERAMSSEHQSRLATAKPSQQRDQTVDRQTDSDRMDARNVSSDLHVVRGDGSNEVLAQLLPASGRKSLTKIQPEYLAKRVFDVVSAVILGLLLSPLILLVVILIRLGGEPVLFRHRRIGRNGRMFQCIKFRTMVPNAEEVLRHLLNEHPELRDEWTQNHKLRNDPRVSAIGRVLRLTSLDELPQIWNVLRGEMSLVGPRPIVRAELLRYGRDASKYLAVKPGLTGLWQVKGRSDTTYRRRVAMDRFYVRHQSLFLDIYILTATPAAVLRRSGAY
jgi:Undecaprenyl-phosphate galactose phosphotransferase WbaP